MLGIGIFCFFISCGEETPTLESDDTSANTEKKQEKIDDDTQINEEDESKPENIPSGTISLLTTIIMSSRSDSLPTVAGDVTWDSTNYGVLRFYPTINQLKIIGSTSSKSFAKSYIWSFTKNGKIYTVRASTDTNSKLISRINPTSNKILSTCSITTNDIYRDLTIVNDTVFYQSKVKEDLFGKYSSGGDLIKKEWPCTGEATTIANYDKNDLLKSNSEIYSAAENLIRARNDGENFVIEVLNQNSGEVEATWGKINTDTPVSGNFFEGSDGLYYLGKDGGVFRINSDGNVKLTQISSDNGSFGNLGIDSESGIIFIVYKDSEEHFLTYNIANKKMEELEVDKSLYGTGIYSNGQFLVKK